MNLDGQQWKRSSAVVRGAQTQIFRQCSTYAIVSIIGEVVSTPLLLRMIDTIYFQ